jgi:hypothetical protein
MTAARVLMVFTIANAVFLLFEVGFNVLGALTH